MKIEWCNPEIFSLAPQNSSIQFDRFIWVLFESLISFKALTFANYTNRMNLLQASAEIPID
jgi:hypothetical protein